MIMIQLVQSTAADADTSSEQCQSDSEECHDELAHGKYNGVSEPRHEKQIPRAGGHSQSTLVSQDGRRSDSGGQRVIGAVGPIGAAARRLHSGGATAVNVVEALLAPVTLADFKRTVFERTPKHWHRSPGHNAGVVAPADFDPADPDSLRRFVGRCVSANVNNIGAADGVGGNLRAMEDISFARDGKIVTKKTAHWPELMPQDLEALMDGTVSLVMNGMQYRSGGVATVAMALEAVLELQASVNLYHTPASGQAFALHYDATEVIVLQLAGTKQWSIVEPVVPLARVDDAQIVPKQLEQRRDLGSAADPMNVSLGPGDMLYLPRGTLHFARNDGGGVDGEPEPSTHLTIAVAVHFWQTVEAAVHTAVMRVWRPGMALVKTAAAVRSALDATVPLLQPPGRGPPIGCPAQLLMHAAVRNAANSPSADLRRAVLVGGKGNATAAARAVDALCEAPPTVADVIGDMVRWDDGGGGVSMLGLGSVITVVRDLNELKSGAGPGGAKAFQPLVDAFDIARDVASGRVGREMMLSPRASAESEAIFAEAWAAFCGGPGDALVNGQGGKAWKGVLKHLRKLELARRKGWHQHWRTGLTLHGVALSDFASQWLSD